MLLPIIGIHLLSKISNCKEERIFWKNNIHLRNFRNCFVFHKPQKVTFLDASDIACGAVTSINGGEHVCHKMLTRDERGRSSTWRELSAIEFSLLSFVPILRMSHVKWYTDSQATAKIVEVGSMKLELYTLVLKILKYAIDHFHKIFFRTLPMAVRLIRRTSIETKEC